MRPLPGPTRLLRWAAAPVAALALATALPASAAAGTFDVTNTSDVAAANPSAGCATPSGSAAAGACTLRSSVQAADATSGSSTITVPAGTYDLTLPQAAGPSSRIDDGTVGNLVLTGDNGATDVTITGAGAATTIIDGGGQSGTLQDRLLHVFPGVTVNVSGLTFRNGYMINNSKANDSGGGAGVDIDNGATATIDDSVITGNTSAAPGWGEGGGIDEGFSFAFARRGAATPFIRVQPTITVTNSTISDNSAANGGGGVEAEGGGAVTLLQDTLASNHAANGGGGYEDGGGDFDTLTNDTITGNVADSNDGGGVFIANGTGDLTNDTITANTASTGSGGDLATSESGTINLRSSIVTAGIGDGGASDCANVSSDGYNLFDDDGSDCSSVATDITNADPGVGPLQDNGGPTQTEALKAGSPAIDAVPPASCTDFSSSNVTVDQRGVPRPQGTNCDIGAFEFAAADLGLTGTAAPNPDNVGQQETFNFTVTNTGPGFATAVIFTETLPSGVTVNSITPSQGSCSGTTSITCNLGVIPDGQATVKVIVTPSAAGTLTTTATVNGAEPDATPSDNSLTLSVPVVGPAAQTAPATASATPPKTTTPPPPPKVVLCASLRHFFIHIQHVSRLGVVRATVFVNGHRVQVLTGRRLHSLVDLRRLPKGTFTVRITALTRTGRTLHGRRTYHTCHTRLPGHKFLLL